jgi:two-component system, NtrC family, nitrogen regulation response regulator NtrX
LRNVVERLLLLADVEVDRAAVGTGLPLAAKGQFAAAATAGALAERMEAFERESIRGELERHEFRMSETARALELERSHLYKKCQHLGIDLRAHRAE